MASPHPGHPPPPGGPGGPPPPGGNAVPDSYFTESRKGEINELKTLLRGFGTERDPKRKRDIIKKVIAYMTLGIDVSRLFTEMMMAIETRDLVIKKMVYLYLTNYARTHPELAQMCTNTLQKDCGNEDPMVRGLALRALCGLNLPQMVEYISEPLRRSLNDGHGYVRKTGVMGILKLFHLDPEGFQEANFVDILYDLLRDSDASVVCNCIIVLNEVMQKTPNGGMAINRAIMLHLLNRIHEFEEFAKVQVLELVPRYIPANQEEGFQIMNLLDPVLRTSSSAAVMATVRAFLSLAEHVGDDPSAMNRQIVARVKAPLVTQISSGSSEIMYSLLKHIDTLTSICPGVFDDEYRQFYVRFNEPTHVKYLKIGILPRMANPDTAPDIVSELAELVHSPNTKLGRLAVQSMGKIACSGNGGAGAAESIARRLVDMMDSTLPHVSSEAATALSLMIRKEPSIKALVAPPLIRVLKYMQEPSGKASVIILLGECGKLVNEAPYALEKLIDSYGSLEDVNVKTALLTTTVRLFFMRPPEVQRMLGRLLSQATEDVSSQDLHDRALMYYRMLRSGADPQTLEQVVSSSTVVAEGSSFAEEDDAELRKELMEEFNTLSIIYGKPSQNFVAPEHQVKYKKMPEEHPLSEGGLLEAPPVTQVPGSTPAPAPAAPATDEVDLLGFGGPPTPQATPAPAQEPVQQSAVVSLNPAMTLDGEAYQSQWGAISDSEAIVSDVPLRSMPGSAEEVEGALAAVNIMTMASGELDTEFKFFLYGQETATGATILIQSNVDKGMPSDAFMIVTFKIGNSPDPQALADQVIQLMRMQLS